MGVKGKLLKKPNIRMQNLTKEWKQAPVTGHFLQCLIIRNSIMVFDS